MKKYRGVYLFITALTVAGCVFLLADAAQSTAADDLKGAKECADSSSAACYQLYPGLISHVRITQTSGGQRDEVQIASQKTSVHASLIPTTSEASLVQVGTAVTVEWYVGSLITVWINGHGILSTSSPFNRADFAYVGWILLWIAAFFGAVMLISRRLESLLALPWASALRDKVFGLAGSQVILPGGTIGWSIRPRVRQIVVLPLTLVVIALVSIRPFMNPDRWLIESIFELCLLVVLLAGWILMLRYSRVIVDRTSLTEVDQLGRVRTWAVTHVDQAARFNLRGPFSPIPCVAFIGRDGTELFSVSGLFWDIDEICSVCAGVGIRVSFDHYLVRPRPVDRRLRAMLLALSLVSAGVLAWSFLPLP